MNPNHEGSGADVIDELLDEDNIFEGATLNEVLRSFAKAFPPKSSRLSPGMRMVCRLTVPARERAAAIEALSRLDKRMPGCEFLLGSNTESACISVSREYRPTKPSEPRPSVPRRPHWLKKILFVFGLSDSTPPAPPSTKTVKLALLQATNAAKEIQPIPPGEKIVAMHVTYAHSHWFAALQSISARFNRSGVPMVLTFAEDGTLPYQLRRALSRHKVMVSFDFGLITPPSNVPQPKPQPTTETMKPKAVTEADMTDATMPPDLDGPLPTLECQVSHEGRSATCSLTFGTDLSFVLGRCGAHEAEITAAHDSVGVRSRLSRSPAHCLHLRLCDSDLLVTAVDKLGLFLGDSGKPVRPGQRLPYPAHLQYQGCDYVLSRPNVTPNVSAAA